MPSLPDEPYTASGNLKISYMLNTTVILGCYISICPWGLKAEKLDFVGDDQTRLTRQLTAGKWMKTVRQSCSVYNS